MLLDIKATTTTRRSGAEDYGAVAMYDNSDISRSRNEWWRSLIAGNSFEEGRENSGCRISRTFDGSNIEYNVH